MRNYYSYVLFATLIAVLGCDKGLAPPPASTVTSLSGHIHFAGQFPPCDSVKTLAVVLSEQAAPFAVADILNNFNKTIFAVTLAPCSFRDTSFTFVVAANTYRYLGVAQLYGDSLMHDWQIVGFSHDVNDSARTFELTVGQQLANVDIRVRFDSLPRQPFIR